MARGAMTPAEPHVQQATCDPAQGDEASPLPVMEVLPLLVQSQMTFLAMIPFDPGLPWERAHPGCLGRWTSTRPEKGQSYLRFQDLALLS
jgi:hypothetical protein